MKSFPLLFRLNGGPPMICSVSCGTIKSFTETFFMQGQTSHLASPPPPPEETGESFLLLFHLNGGPLLNSFMSCETIKSFTETFFM